MVPQENLMQNEWSFSFIINRRSHGLETTAEEDYILKANLRKCQFELGKATDQTGQQAKEIESITKEVCIQYQTGIQ